MCIYYATYTKKDGTWARACSFNAKLDLKDLMVYLAKGRPYIIAESVGELEEEKKASEEDRGCSPI